MIQVFTFHTKTDLFFCRYVLTWVAAHILAWNAHSKSAHVFEYGKTDSLSGDIFHTVDMSYNAEPLMSRPIPTSHYNNRSNQGGSYYVAPRQIYALPTCRYRPAHSAWVAPFPKGKTEHFRENPPLAGIKVLPGIARLMKYSESESRPPYARSWCVLQLCYDGSVRSKVWCRRRIERDDVRALKCFHRPPTGFDDLQVEHLDTVQKEIELETRHVDMSSVFEGEWLVSRQSIMCNTLTLSLQISISMVRYTM